MEMDRGQRRVLPPLPFPITLRFIQIRACDRHECRRRRRWRRTSRKTKHETWVLIRGRGGGRRRGVGSDARRRRRSPNGSASSSAHVIAYAYGTANWKWTRTYDMHPLCLYNNMPVPIMAAHVKGSPIVHITAEETKKKHQHGITFLSGCVSLSLSLSTRKIENAHLTIRFFFMALEWPEYPNSCFFYKYHLYKLGSATCCWTTVMAFLNANVNNDCGS